jgi:hypothetical protein
MSIKAKFEDIVNGVKDIDDAKETIGNLLEIIDDMKNEDTEDKGYYQGTAIGFVL